MIDGNLYALSVWQALYSRRSLARVPLLVDGMRARDPTMIADAAMPLLNGLTGQTSIGLQYTAACYDDAPLAEPQERALRGSFARVLDITDVLPNPALCAALHPFRAPAEHLRRSRAISPP